MEWQAAFRFRFGDEDDDSDDASGDNGDVDDNNAGGNDDDGDAPPSSPPPLPLPAQPTSSDPTLFSAENLPQTLACFHKGSAAWSNEAAEASCRSLGVHVKTTTSCAVGAGPELRLQANVALPLPLVSPGQASHVALDNAYSEKPIRNLFC